MISRWESSVRKYRRTNLSLRLVPQGDHNIVENINKLIKNLLSVKWFVFYLVFLTYAAAILLCAELVCARSDPNCAIFFSLLLQYINKRGNSFTKPFEQLARNRFELFSSSPFCNQNWNKRKLYNVRIRSPVRILKETISRQNLSSFFRCFPRIFSHTYDRYRGKYPPLFTPQEVWIS